MTIDKQKLKALAEAAVPGPWECREAEGSFAVCWEKGWVADSCTEQDILDNRFIAAASPATILALLAEIEEDAMHMRAFGEVMHSQAEQIELLKADSKALHRALGECADELSAEIICKHGGQKPEDMHPVTRRLYERDMAAVTEARAAMAKSVSHG